MFTEEKEVHTTPSHSKNPQGFPLRTTHTHNLMDAFHRSKRNRYSYQPNKEKYTAKYISCKFEKRKPNICWHVEGICPQFPGSGMARPNVFTKLQVQGGHRQTTIGTSFADSPFPCKHFYQCERKRNFRISKGQIMINQDVTWEWLAIDTFQVV